MCVYTCVFIYKYARICLFVSAVMHENVSLYYCLSLLACVYTFLYTNIGASVSNTLLYAQLCACLTYDRACVFIYLYIFFELLNLEKGRELMTFARPLRLVETEDVNIPL